MTRFAFKSVVRRFLPISAAVGSILFVPAVGVAEHSQRTFDLAGFSEVRVDAALRLPEWERLAPRLNVDEQSLQRCRVDGHCLSQETKALSAFIDDQRSRPSLEQLQAINAFFNTHPYAADVERFGTRDVWQSPLAFMAGGGDCEDYAIAKYFALRMLGFSEDRLRIIVGIDETRDQPHAVVAVSLQDGLDVAVLDNRSNEVMADNSFAGFYPKYAVTIAGRWVYAPTTGTAGQEVTAGAGEWR